MFPATSSCCLHRNNMRSLAQRKPWLPQALAISRWPWEVEWPVRSVARGTWSVGTGIVHRLINQSQPPCFAGWWALLLEMTGISVWFFPGMLPVQHALFQSHGSHLLPAAPVSLWVPFPADCSVTTEGPRTAPGIPLPPCFLPKAEIQLEGKAKIMNRLASVLSL